MDEKWAKNRRNGRLRERGRVRERGHRLSEKMVKCEGMKKGL